MLKSTQLRPGMIIMHEGDLHVVYSVDHLSLIHIFLD